MQLIRSMMCVLAVVMLVSCAGTGTKSEGTAKSEPTVRVRVASAAGEMKILPGAHYTVQAGSTTANVDEGTTHTISIVGKNVSIAPEGGGKIASGKILRLQSSAAPVNGVLPGLTVAAVPVGVGWWWETTEKRRYEGIVEFSVNDAGEIDVIVELPVEEYLRGVVPSEIGADSPMEAMKAQAVAARSETMTALVERQYAGPNYDICADVQCQVFSGSNKRSAESDAAVRATRGIVMAFGGKPIPAYYASSCGGVSEDVANVWPTRDRGIPCWSSRVDGEIEAPDLTKDENVRAWIESSPDVYCNGEKHPELPNWTKKNFAWTKETSVEDMTKFVAKQKDIGRVTDIQPIKRGESGRLMSLRFVGEKGTLDVGPELAIRRTWTPPLKSGLFVVDRKGDNFVIRGAGYGHGVGMCQTGAMGRALAGQDFREILSHYYKDVELLTMYQ